MKRKKDDKLMRKNVHLWESQWDELQKVEEKTGDVPAWSIREAINRYLAFLKEPKK